MISNYSHELEVEIVQGSYFIAIGMFMGYLLYALAIILGIPLNLLLLYRMIKLSTQLTDFNIRGTGIPLCLFSMAIFDLVSLGAICVHYVLSFELSISPFVHGMVCKMAIFALHFSTSVSIWSWLLMSTIRYLSVYQPLFHYRIWRLPSLVLSIVFAISTLTNLPIIFMVDYDPGNDECVQLELMEDFPQMNRIFLCVEIFWSFILPTAVIIFVDSSVYFRRQNRESSTLGQRRQSHKKTKRALWRWLIIALIDVLLNTPENVCRLVVILGIIDLNSNSEVYLFGRMFAQVLYYSQFAFNGVYLALFIYDKSTRFNDSNKSNKVRESVQNTQQESLCRVVHECRDGKKLEIEVKSCLLNS